MVLAVSTLAFLINFWAWALLGPLAPVIGQRLGLAPFTLASPQVFGDQTDVPESVDWWNSSYLMMWGSNVPVTRTPDAHFMTEARYRGQKVVVVSPDYADNVKFADTWLSPQPGTDGALAMAMEHVILRDFFVQRQAPSFADYVRRYTDLPFLVSLRANGEALVPHILVGMLLFALFPFTRLVHAFSGFAAVRYLFRPYVVYRSRAEAQPRRGWEPVGVPGQRRGKHDAPRPTRKH
ncbi:respiratory nitrate reductase subunit gamma [Saccharopolyspora shandongensis]|uniref:respiratory nitrate reductase subunit gamma n=1 Tax=Saccharopolyspora shandongensis TaxID=418495 RepID=UPI00341A1811